MGVYSLSLNSPDGPEHARAQQALLAGHSSLRVSSLLVGAEAGLQAAVLLDEDHVLPDECDSWVGEGGERGGQDGRAGGGGPVIPTVRR